MTIDNWLVIDNDVVTNVIVVESGDMSAVVALRKQHQTVFPSTPQPAQNDRQPGIGWTRSAGNRFDPPPPPVAVVP